MIVAWSTGDVFSPPNSAGFPTIPLTAVKILFCIKTLVSCLVSTELPSKQSVILYTKSRKQETVHVLF